MFNISNLYFALHTGLITGRLTASIEYFSFMCPGFEISVLCALFLVHLHVLWCSYYYQHRQAFFVFVFLQTSSFSSSCHKRIYYYWAVIASTDIHACLTRANSCPKCDRKSRKLMVDLQLVHLPHCSDDRHTETCLAKPKCPACPISQK